MTTDPIVQNIGRVAGQWWHGAQTAFQGFQSAVSETVPKITQTLERGQLALNNRLLHSRKPSDVGHKEDKETKGAAMEMEPWKKNSTWVDEKPVMEVSVPQGTLCQLNSTFTVGLPPGVVFNILIDPENKRVFRDIQEVRYRKVLEDYGHRQVVELEQAAIWRFLWLSGILTVFVRVDQDRKALSLSYELGKTGFMKRFEGSWQIQPLYIDAATDGGRVASLIRLQQVVEPALIPPPPISWYVRGITSKTTEKMLIDLQAEGKRLREDSPESKSSTQGTEERDGDMEKKKTTVLQRYWKASSISSRRNLRKRRGRDVV